MNRTKRIIALALGRSQESNFGGIQYQRKDPYTFHQSSSESEDEERVLEENSKDNNFNDLSLFSNPRSHSRLFGDITQNDRFEDCNKKCISNNEFCTNYYNLNISKPGDLIDSESDLLSYKSAQENLTMKSSADQLNKSGNSDKLVHQEKKIYTNINNTHLESGQYGNIVDTISTALSINLPLDYKSKTTDKLVNLENESIETTKYINSNSIISSELYVPDTSKPDNAPISADEAPVRLVENSSIVSELVSLDLSRPENMVFTITEEIAQGGESDYSESFVSESDICSNPSVSEYEPNETDSDFESTSNSSSLSINTLHAFQTRNDFLHNKTSERLPRDITPAIDVEPHSTKLEYHKHNNSEDINHLSVPTTSEQVLPEPYDCAYTKKPSARERPTICPICFKDVITHFSRHLLRNHKNHKEVKLLETLKPRSKERLALVAALRKQGYFILKTEKNIVRPVKSSKKLDAEYFICTYCLGQYTKKLLFKHVKLCKSKPQGVIKQTNCLTASQTFMAMVNSKNSDFLKSSRVKTEVFGIMRPDNVSATVKNDPLICLYGESLLSKHKRQQIVNVVSNKMRELGRLLINLRSKHETNGLFDVLKPERFQSLVLATKEISGFDISTKSFRSPSLAMHMGTTLKVVCDVAYKLVLEKRIVPGIKWNDQQAKKTEIKDLKKLLEGHWNNELSSLALKNLKENHWEKPLRLPLTSDLELFNDYLNKLAEESFCQLRINIECKKNYRQLTQCVLAKTVIFNRKRIGDVQFLTIENYSRDYSTINPESFSEALTETEKIICKNHKRIVTGGKGSTPVPILFSKQTQKYISCLLQVRKETDTVPKSNPYLFANPDSQDRWMSGANAIRRLAKECGAKHPDLLTSTRFRKHIATTLQLMSMDENEMEQVATFMGHTKKTHEEFYRLPQDIYQTAKVAKVLLLIEKGKGDLFRGKKLNEIDVDTEIYYSSESDDDERPNVQKVLERVSHKKKLSHEPLETVAETDRSENIKELEEKCESVSEEISHEFNQDEELVINEYEPVKKKARALPKSNTEAKLLSGRVKWSEKQKKLVCEYFKDHIKKKITPKKHECDQFLSLHSDIFENKNWVRIKTYVYNTFRTK